MARSRLLAIPLFVVLLGVFMLQLWLPPVDLVFEEPFDKVEPLVSGGPK